MAKIVSEEVIRKIAEKYGVPLYQRNVTNITRSLFGVLFTTQNRKIPPINDKSATDDYYNDTTVWTQYTISLDDVIIAIANKVLLDKE